MSFWGKKPNDENKKPATPGDFGVVPEPQTTLNNAGHEGATSTERAVNSERRQELGESQYGKVRSALGPGTVIQGRLSFDSVVSIDGKLGGEIFSSKALLVGKTGVVDAKIEAASVIIRGTVKGTVRATERIEIREGGQLIGDVVTPCLVMDEGCTFHGSCAMTQKAGLSRTAPQETTILTSDEETPVPGEQPVASLH